MENEGTKKKRLRIWLQIRQQQEKSRDTRSYFVCVVGRKLIIIMTSFEWIALTFLSMFLSVFVCVCLHHKSLIWRLNQDQITWTSTADDDDNNIKYTITTRRRQRRFHPNNNFIHLIYVNLPESRECFALREFFQRTHTNTASSIQIMSIKVEAELEKKKQKSCLVARSIKKLAHSQLSFNGRHKQTSASLFEIRIKLDEQANKCLRIVCCVCDAK